MAHVVAVAGSDCACPLVARIDAINVELAKLIAEKEAFIAQKKMELNKTWQEVFDE